MILINSILIRLDFDLTRFYFDSILILFNFDLTFIQLNFFKKFKYKTF